MDLKQYLVGAEVAAGHLRQTLEEPGVMLGSTKSKEEALWYTLYVDPEVTL